MRSQPVGSALTEHLFGRRRAFWFQPRITRAVQDSDHALPGLPAPYVSSGAYL